MKPTYLFLLIAASLLIGWQGTDVLKRFSIDREDARRALASAYKTGYLSPPNAADELLKAVPEGERAAVVQALGKFVRSAVNEPAFLDLILDDAPDEENDRGKWAHEIVADYDADIVRMKENLKNCAESPTPEDKKRCEDATREVIQSIEQMRDKLKSDSANHNRQVRDQILEIRTMRKEQRQELANAHRPKLIERLEGFVTMAKSVDFAAQLTPCRGGRKQCFVNPAYESKNADWKRCYRAGRAYTTAAIAYAEQWLVELKTGR